MCSGRSPFPISLLPVCVRCARRRRRRRLDGARSVAEWRVVVASRLTAAPFSPTRPAVSNLDVVVYLVAQGQMTLCSRAEGRWAELWMVSGHCGPVSISSKHSKAYVRLLIITIVCVARCIRDSNCHP